MKQDQLINEMIATVPHMSQITLGKCMNPPMSQAAINRTIKNGNMTINRLWEICEVLGYEIIVQPKRSGRKQDGQFVFTGEAKSARAVKLNAAKNKEKKGGAEQCGFTE